MPIIIWQPRWVGHGESSTHFGPLPSPWYLRQLTISLNGNMIGNMRNTCGYQRVYQTLRSSAFLFTSINHVLELDLFAKKIHNICPSYPQLCKTNSQLLSFWPHPCLVSSWVPVHLVLESTDFEKYKNSVDFLQKIKLWFLILDPGADNLPCGQHSCALDRSNPQKVTLHWKSLEILLATLLCSGQCSSTECEDKFLEIPTDSWIFFPDLPWHLPSHARFSFFKTPIHLCWLVICQLICNN